MIRFTGSARAIAIALGFAVASSALAPSARADQLVLDLATKINGTAPSGGTPWVTATFTSTTAGVVDLKISNNMPAGEFVTTFLFNTVPGLNFSNITVANSGGINDVGTSQGENSTNGGSNTKAGLFDFEIDFQTSNHGTPGRLDGGDYSTFTITDTIDKITAASFNYGSTVDGSNPGGWLAAADVQGIPGSKSGSIGTNTASVPEPASMTMALIGLTLAGARSIMNRARDRKASAA